VEVVSYLFMAIGLLIGLYGVYGLFKYGRPSRPSQRATDNDDDLDVSDDAIARLDARAQSLMAHNKEAPPIASQPAADAIAAVSTEAKEEPLPAVEAETVTGPVADAEVAVHAPETMQAEYIIDAKDAEDDSFLALFAEVMETGGAPQAIRDAIQPTSIEELLEEARSVQRLVRPGV
jgi:hypothetical protein